jgi:hypothetical protein
MIFAALLQIERKKCNILHLKSMLPCCSEQEKNVYRVKQLL